MLMPFHRNDFTQLLNCNDHQRPIVSWPAPGRPLANALKQASNSNNSKHPTAESLDPSKSR